MFFCAALRILASISNWLNSFAMYTEHLLGREPAENVLQRARALTLKMNDVDGQALVAPDKRSFFFFRLMTKLWQQDEQDPST